MSMHKWQNLKKWPKLVRPRTLFTCQLHRWNVSLCGHAGINHLPGAKAQPKPSNQICCNGVELQSGNVIEEHGQRAIHKAGVPSWTPASTAQAVQQRAQGSQQRAVLEEFTWVHTETSWLMVLATWMEDECIAQIIEQALTRTIGRMLLTGPIQGRKKYLCAMLAQAAEQNRLPEDWCKPNPVLH